MLPVSATCSGSASAFTPFMKRHAALSVPKTRTSCLFSCSVPRGSCSPRMKPNRIWPSWPATPSFSGATVDSALRAWCPVRRSPLWASASRYWPVACRSRYHSSSCCSAFFWLSPSYASTRSSGLCWGSCSASPGLSTPPPLLTSIVPTWLTPCSKPSGPPHRCVPRRTFRRI